MTTPNEISDSVCRTFLRHLREFGYPSLTFEQVREAADRIQSGNVDKRRVIDVIMESELRKAGHLK